MSEQIKEFMKTHLHDVECYVRCEGVMIEKGVEKTCHLVFENNWGLGIYSTLMYNSKSISMKIQELTEDRKLFKYGDVLTYLRGEFIKEIEQTEIQLGRIYAPSIIKITTTYNKGVLRDCCFVFAQGTICELINIKPYKPKE